MNNYLIRAGASDEEVKKWFRQLGSEKQLKWKERYEHLLLRESGQYNPGNFPLWDKYNAGKPRPYPDRFPWMYEGWSHGLDLLNQVLSEDSEQIPIVYSAVDIKDAFAMKLKQMNQ